MTDDEAEEAIKAHWRAQWEALSPVDDAGFVPYTFDGETSSALPYWARVTVRHTSSRQATMGGIGTRRMERRGVIFVQLFADVNQGTRVITKLVKNARDVIETKSIALAGVAGTVTTYSSPPESVDESRWIARTLAVPFVYSETR